MILDHLIGLGHRRIGFMGSPAWPLVPSRLRAFHAHLASKGIDVPDLYVSEVDRTPYQPGDFAAIERLHRHAIAGSKRLLEQANPPTAIVCAADAFALGALKGAKQLGLDVPRDISVTSFDGTDGTFTCQPELTTLRRPIERVADEAIKLLLGLIEAPADAALQKRILVAPELIVRESCGPV